MKSNLCRCCLVDSCYKDITNEYFYAGRKEVYSEMLLETFNITICDNTYKRLICEQCILKLRAATDFKKQVFDAEETLKLTLLNNNDAEENVEMKQEIDCHFDDDISPPFDDDSGLENHPTVDEFDDNVNWDDQEIGAEEGEILVIKLEPKITKEGKKKKLPIMKHDSKIKSKQTSTRGKPIKSKSTEKDKTKQSHNETQRNLKENSIKLILNSNLCLFESLRTKFKCFSCQNTFVNITDLREHSKTHTNSKHLKFRLNSLRGASFRNVEISNLECKLCAASCTDLNDLKDHLIIHDIKFNDSGHVLIPYKLEKEIKCVICTQEFNTFSRLSIHMNTHYTHNVCEICGASFINRLSLRTHLNSLHTEKKCTFCSETFPTVHAKTKHMRKVHKTARSKRHCVLCNKTFPYTHSLFEHKIKEHGAKRQTAECTDCGKTFLSPLNLKIHIRSVHMRERNYPCSVCESRFFTKCDQKRHERTHLDVRSFSCSYCEGRFKSKDSLRRHLRRQHGFLFDSNK